VSGFEFGLRELRDVVARGRSEGGRRESLKFVLNSKEKLGLCARACCFEAWHFGGEKPAAIKRRLSDNLIS